MNKKLIFLVVILLFALTGCKEEVKSINITGDVFQVDFETIIESIEKEPIKIDNKRIDAYEMQDVINALEPYYLSNDIYLIASDGYVNKIDQDTIENTYIYFSKTRGWCYYSEKHPVNSKIKDIKKIIVANDCSEKRLDVGFNVIINDLNIHYDISELLINKSSVFYHLDGTTTKSEVDLDVMKKKEVIQFKDLDLEYESLLLMSETGNHKYIKSDDGYLEVLGSNIDYIDLDSKTIISGVKGVIVDYPGYSVMDTYSDTKYFLDKDVPVMIIFIDGFSFFQYETVKEIYPDLFVSNIVGVKKATTVYKPVTNSGFAAMITGKAPIDNAILNRDYREVKESLIFDLTDNSVLVEGSIKVLNLSVRTILNTDENDNGYTDDEIFKSAVNELDGNLDLILVHFHGFDDKGHENGASRVKTLEYIKTIDEYVTELTQKWNGKIILTSDHGMHDTEDGGSHGDFRAEDIYIPYVIYNGGLYE